MKRDDGSRWIADHHGSSRDEEPRLELLGGEFVQVHHGHAPRSVPASARSSAVSAAASRRSENSAASIPIRASKGSTSSSSGVATAPAVIAARATKCRRRRRAKNDDDDSGAEFVGRGTRRRRVSSSRRRGFARRVVFRAVHNTRRAASRSRPRDRRSRPRDVDRVAAARGCARASCGDRRRDGFPDGDPVPAPGAGPMWARLRYAPPSAGDDRREGMVADVCDDDARAPTASVVWEDGAEEDGVPLARLGPVVVARPDDDPKTAATNARERGNARFRAGDHAAAAAEYVEACAWLLRAIPTGARAIPGRAEDWRVPGVVDWRAPDANPGPTDDGRVSTAPFRPTVGARVRMLGEDGASRSGMVSYVESDEELCDVMFDDDDALGGGDEEEVGVPFPQTLRRRRTDHRSIERPRGDR